MAYKAQHNLCLNTKSLPTLIVHYSTNPLSQNSTLHICSGCSLSHFCLSPTISSAGMFYLCGICCRLKLYFLPHLSQVISQSQVPFLVSLDTDQSFFPSFFANGYLNMSIFMNYIVPFILLLSFYLSYFSFIKDMICKCSLLSLVFTVVSSFPRCIASSK